MQELNYDLLQKLVQTQRAHVQLVDVDVTRLGDDESEIRTGEDVALVATGKLRVHLDALPNLKPHVTEKMYQEVAKCVDLVTIAPTGDLESTLPLDEDSVAKWMHEHFRFNFFVDGRGTEVFRSVGGHNGHGGSLPWVKTVNTADVDRDQFVVSVKVDDLTPPPPPPPAQLPGPRNQLAIGHALASLDGTRFSLLLELEGAFDSVTDLQGKTFWIPLHPEHHGVRLGVTVRGVDTGHDRLKLDPPVDERKPSEQTVAVEVETIEHRLIVERVAPHDEPSGAKKSRIR